MEFAGNPQAREIMQRARVAYATHGLSITGCLPAYRAAPAVGLDYFWSLGMSEAGAPVMLAIHAAEDLARAARCACRASWVV